MTNVPDFTILKTAKCPTLSGKSTLTYHVGKSPSDELFLKVSANTGGGFFNEEWISLDRIREALEKQTEETITAVALYPLFRGKSVNTPAFLLATLKHEKLLKQSKQRQYQWADLKAFTARIDKLVASDVDLDSTTKKAPRKNTGS